MIKKISAFLSETVTSASSAYRPQICKLSQVMHTLLHLCETEFKLYIEHVICTKGVQVEKSFQPVKNNVYILLMKMEFGEQKESTSIMLAVIFEDYHSI